MIANRKFAAADCGLPMRWTTLTGKGVAIDDKTVYAGKHAVRLEGGCGIWQQHDWLTFKKGRKYVFRIWAKADAGQTLSMRIIDRPGFHKLFTGENELKVGDWELWTGEFTAPVSARGAKLEIRSQSSGTLWLGVVSLMPADNFHGMRRDVIELFKQLKPSSLRWPGGCFAEYYNWKDGLLPVDKRPSVGPHRWVGLLPDSDGYDNHDIGTDEFMALCRELNCLPVITTRFGGGGTADEAADWVDYCNGNAQTTWGKRRAERGYAEPFGVKYWYVGNEIWGMSLVDNKDPKVCAPVVRQFAAAMKRKDAGIKLNAGVLPNRQWLEPLFKDNDGLLDFVQGGFYFGDKLSPENVLDNPTEQELKSWRQLIDTLIPDGKQTGIIYYEWNVMWDRQGDALSGIFAAEMLNMFCREAETLRLEMANYFQPVAEGAIRVTPADCSLEPAGQVFAMFAAHQNNILLDVAAPSALSGLDVCASISRDKKRIFITAVNRNAKEEKTLNLSLKNFVPDTEALIC